MFMRRGRMLTRRSYLLVSVRELALLELNATIDADVCVLDVEDSVGPHDKEDARRRVVLALRELERKSSAIFIRVNGPGTRWFHDDLAYLIEGAGKCIDAFVIPKVEGATDVVAAATLLRGLEQAAGLTEPIALSVAIETPAAMVDVDAIAASAPERVESLVFAFETAAVFDGPYTVLTDPLYDGVREIHWGESRHYHHARTVAACRANGLRPIDGSVVDSEDPDAYRAAALRAACLGYEGKLAADAAEVAIANEAFRSGRLDAGGASTSLH